MFSPDARVVELFGGQEGLEPLSEPTVIEALRITTPRADSSGALERFADYPIAGESVRVDADTANMLVSVLSDPRTYIWHASKTCGFEPGVAVQFVGKSSKTQVVFCFACDGLVVYRDDKRVGGEDFDGAHSQLVQVFKRIFPDDEEIQRLQ